MLNKSKLLSQIQEITDQLFIDHCQELAHARELWQAIIDDPLFIHKVKASDAPWALPHWQGAIDACVTFEPSLERYRVISVDGSQVYPDRHQGTSCFLINIGSVIVQYQCGDKPVLFNSIPYVFAGDDAHEEQQSPTELVNCRRQELELSAGVSLATAFAHDAEIPMLLLYDGSLIFWHLDAKEEELRAHYLQRYCAALQTLCDQERLTAGYISVAKSKEMVHLLRLKALERGIGVAQAQQLTEHIVDAQIAHFFLQPYQRSTVFASQVSIAHDYPADVAPYFFYLHVGTEIGRVEIPAWIARDDAKVDMVARIILDQCVKGFGYPVVIAEAHEQAVVKGPDREFFYHLITKYALMQKQRVLISPKSLKKRGIGI